MKGQNPSIESLKEILLWQVHVAVMMMMMMMMKKAMMMSMIAECSRLWVFSMCSSSGVGREGRLRWSPLHGQGPRTPDQWKTINFIIVRVIIILFVFLNMFCELFSVVLLYVEASTVTVSSVTIRIYIWTESCAWFIKNWNNRSTMIFFLLRVRLFSHVIRETWSILHVSTFDQKSLATAWLMQQALKRFWNFGVR